jgi:hypothetical protein
MLIVIVSNKITSQVYGTRYAEFSKTQYRKHPTISPPPNISRPPNIRDVPDPDTCIRYPVKFRHPALSGINLPDIYRIVL